MKEGRLEAYRDGELGRLARWRVERVLARSERARAELAALEELGRRVRETAPSGAAPDLWLAIRARLPEPAVAAFQTPPRRRTAWLPWAAPALAAVAVAVALGLLGGEVDPAPEGSVRWLHARGRPALVLQDDREATIIWVLESRPGRTSGRASHGVG